MRALTRVFLPVALLAAALLPNSCSAAKLRPVVELTEARPTELIRRFNAEASDTRLLVLLSPT